MKIIKLLYIFLLALAFNSTNVRNSYSVTFRTGGIRLNKKVTSLKDLKRKNVTIQTLDYSCGAAGLSTLLKYHFRDPVSEKEIIDTLLKTVPLKKVLERKGFSLYDLKNSWD